MVHIPFLNIEVPEIRIAEVMPDVVTGTLRLCTRTLDAANRLTHPLPPEIEEWFVADVVESFPREIQRVLQRGIEGKHKNEDQLSSELEDAAFDYYRRQMRTQAVGATEDDQEDVTAYKLGLDRPSAQQQVWELYRLEHRGAEQDEAAALAVEGTQAEREAIEVALAEARRSMSEAEQFTTVQESSFKRLKGKVRTTTNQTASTAASAGLGLALSVAVIKGMGMLAQQLLKLRKPKKKKAKKPKPAPAASPSLSGAAPTRAADVAIPEQPRVEAQKAEPATRTRGRTTTRKR